MDAILESCIKSLKLQGSLSHGQMEVIPLFAPQVMGPEYTTLEEALAADQLLISEISDGGSVPQLKAVNEGKIPILLIDGEEIAGAKQNRVLNTTILVPPVSELVIPVSCTEHGRWSYNSPTFSNSNVMMDYTIRQKKMASVSHSLRYRASRQSNQSEIWNEIDHLSRRANVSSPTGAMKDVHENYTEKMKEYIEAFSLQAAQQGILVYMDDRPVGMELLSRPEAYARIHDKLIRSYAVEALISEDTKRKSSQNPEKSKEFLQRVCTSQSESYPAVGLGTEYRLDGDCLVGSALTYDDAVIHLALFTMQQDREQFVHSRMASFRNRRAYRSARTYDDSMERL